MFQHSPSTGSLVLYVNIEQIRAGTLHSLEREGDDLQLLTRRESRKATSQTRVLPSVIQPIQS